MKEIMALAKEMRRRKLYKEASELDNVLQSILQMIEDKSIDINKTKAGDELVFDLFIDNKGKAVGAEPASGDLGSTCIMNEESPEELGDFSDLDSTNISKDEAFAAGSSSCSDEDGVEQADAGEGAADQEQVSLFNYTTKNFDLCPGAVKAFEHIKSIDMGGDSRERALNAIQDTDRLLGVEREVLDSKSASKDQVKEAIGLSRSISNYVGLISEEIDQDLTGDFEFLDMHIEKIMEHLND